jgi:8-oxo-dGTP diphosphatase
LPGPILQFGTQMAGVEYRERLGGYVMVTRQGGEVALVETSAGCFLPGGGQEPGETPELAAVRESREECDFRISIRALVGVADELVLGSGADLHIRKRCTFFTADLVDAGDGGESDHRVVWTMPSSAALRLTHGSQRWAVRTAFGITEAAIPAAGNQEGCGR